MAVSSTRRRSPVSVTMIIGGTGTRNLPARLAAGTWKVTTDNTQSFTVSQFLLEAAANSNTFGVVIRGGLGSVTLTEECDQVTLTTGTFPLIVTFESR